MECPASDLRPAAAVAIAIVLASFFAATRLLRRNKQKRPPMAGTTLHQLLNFERLFDYQAELSGKHRTFRMLAPDCSHVYTVEPANAEYILKTNFSNYGRGKRLHGIFKDLFGDGIFNVDGEKWKQQRKIAGAVFSAKSLRHYSTGVFQTSAAKLASIVSQAAVSNQMLDMQDLLMRLTMGTIFEIGFGVSLDTLSGMNSEVLAFMEAFDGANARLLLRFASPIWKVMRFFNVGAEAKMKERIRLIDDFIYRCIDEKTRQMTNQPSDFAEKGDILTRFLLERERDPRGMDSKYLRDIILNFVIAGKDTTAGTLSWFLYMMCKHPQVQERVLQEVITVTRNGDQAMPYDEFTDRISEEAIARMVYLHAALTETLRLYPSVPMDGKHCYADDVLPDGFVVKKGDMVDFQPYAMGRMEFLWGDDAAEFRPERWLNSEGEFVQESPFKFTAFQGGPRICLGKEFAYRQMKIVAATLIYFFQFKIWDDDAAIRYRPMLTLQFEGGLFLQVHHRHNTTVRLMGSKRENHSFHT